MFTIIIEDILPLNYYSDLLGIMVDCSLINTMLQKYLPDLYNHFIALNFEINLDNFIYKWLVSLFIQGFSEKVIILIK